MKEADKLVEIAIELQSIAQAGLHYGRDDFDRERYQRIRDIAAEIMAEKTQLSWQKVQDLFCGDEGYQTPKVDTRAAIIQDDEILLVKERNGLWSLPGGWCEMNMSPMENTVKEAKEEAGREVKVKSVIAVQDRDKHNQPPYAYSIVKIFYLCEDLGGHYQENIETSASRYFKVDQLPELDPERTTQEQIAMCFQAYQSENWQTQFD
ncbi:MULTISPECIES: NUDIX hydrolase N-terminal domain-containing protein [Aerococcus]|uniref:NUDIX domain-containing protein n=2 Tax=Aerococcus TaxID=1375 RepID=A0A178HCP8_9LACT|nr:MULTISPECIES: NUDIX hydrolase [Aerococcus]KAA9220456.1 NUDIX hydrolase [Aerococcus loyolae]KAA9265588.1 NUDIX hydrolase [Aerococcus loyolae]MCY3025656.1 NUDIX hydrolase [Aerococcus loyolae]MCY3027303.1 NUDIX hydrolase [Aerococcus loyolae]MCY3028925.1 NUDIX hydrolase [Aerococcus loyolae]